MLKGLQQLKRHSLLRKINNFLDIAFDLRKIVSVVMEKPQYKHRHVMRDKKASNHEYNIVTKLRKEEVIKENE